MKASQFSEAQKAFILKHETGTEAAATPKCGEPEERRRGPFIRVRGSRGFPVRAVGDVEDVQEELERSVSSQASPPARADIELEVIGSEGAVAPALVLDVHHFRPFRRAAVDAGR